MEGRMSKYRQVSPERSKVWTEKSGKYVQNRKVPVVYYLSRNRQLDHPHFIQVPLSSSQGLYLRDVIQKLNGLRGRGMASMYSWSCKRSYKNGFVWHDLCEDDLIIPAHGNEYVLKGSEVIEESNLDHLNPGGTPRIQNVKELQEAHSRSQDDSSSYSSSSMNGKDTKHHEDEISRSSDSSGVSVDSRTETSSSYKDSKNGDVADASTQTDKGIRGSVSPPSSSSLSLESLIRIDASKNNSFRRVEEDDGKIPPNPMLKASNMLMQLISCGSMSVRDNNFGLVPTYRQQFSHLKFPSSLYSSSVMLGELDCLSENPRLTLEDKEYFSGSFAETKTVKEEGCSHRRTSSFNADRSCSRQLESEAEVRSKCLPMSIKAYGGKQARSESMRFSACDKARTSSAGQDKPNGDSSTITTSSLVSIRQEKGKIIKIEERLASGARVIIQSEEAQG